MLLVKKRTLYMETSHRIMLTSHKLKRSQIDKLVSIIAASFSNDSSPSDLKRWNCSIIPELKLLNTLIEIK